MEIAIIGAGAAGCFAAANIPSGKVNVTIYEKSGKALQKVKVSGGGRCNTTHQLFEIPELIRRYPRGEKFLRKTLYEFGPEQTIDWFAERGVTLKAEGDGRMFPVTDNSETIIECLWTAMKERGTKVQFHKSVESVAPASDGILIHFADGTGARADRVLVACGGYPKASSYQWIEALGHTIAAPVPSLFTFNLPGNPITSLMGVSVPEARVKIAGTKISETGPVLITHWGLSGPAILRASAWGARELHQCDYKFKAVVNWLNESTDNDVRDKIQELRRDSGKLTVYKSNPFYLPRRLWEFLLSLCGVSDEQRWGDLAASSQNKLSES
ncbi:MAG: aminoacetone oxidase family FAD-binding enzyme, partial [Sphingobacteriales bacterium]